MSDHPIPTAGDETQQEREEPGAGTLVGRTLQGKYRLETLLAEGTTSAVYSARRADLDKPVAVKVLARSLCPEDDTRFLREARVGAVVKHPGIAEILDYGVEDDGLRFYAMELLEGEPLARRLAREGRLPIDEAVAIAASIASALGAVHAKGYIHGDLKPTNVFLVPNALGGRDVKLVGFGMAPPINTAEVRRTLLGLGYGERATLPNWIHGSPSYMSPEQALGEPIDARADVYALGGVLYEMLTGSPPFISLNAAGQLVGQLSQTPETPSARAPDADIGPELDAVVMRALAKDRAERHESAAELSRELWGALAEAKQGRGGSGAGAHTPTAATRATQRTRALAIAATVGALLLAAATVVSVRGTARRQPVVAPAAVTTSQSPPLVAKPEPSAPPESVPASASAREDAPTSPTASAARPRSAARATASPTATSTAASAPPHPPEDFRIDDLKTPFP